MREHFSLLRTNADAVLIKELQRCTYHFPEMICAGVRYQSLSYATVLTSVLGNYKS